jgi:ubiquinone/menaquinone biosynthesis C-methylase UbiE
MSSETKETFQLTQDMAEAYERHFVPAFFAQWAPQLVEAAGVRPGQRVLDVACGTGIVARTAAPRVGTAGSVTGVDINEAMLSVARRVSPDLEWRQGDAAALPFEDAEFDAALSQMAMMFFPDPAAALREMARVVQPPGTVAILIPAGLDANPAYEAFVDIVTRHAGPAARNLGHHVFRPRRPRPHGRPVHRGRPPGDPSLQSVGPEPVRFARRGDQHRDRQHPAGRRSRPRHPRADPGRLPGGVVTVGDSL